MTLFHRYTAFRAVCFVRIAGIITLIALPAASLAWVPTDPLFTNQWAMYNTSQSGSMTNRDVCAEKAWDITRGTSSVVIAILDDGFQTNHPDLQGNFFINTNEYGGGKETNNVDEDDNGYTDDWCGWNFFSTNNNPSPVVSADYHGTCIAGLIVAAADNGEGIAGLANQCRLLPIRVVSGDSSVTADVWADAIKYAATLADVISIGCILEPDSQIYDAFRYAVTEGRNGLGCVVCVALGNDGVMRRFSSDPSSAPEVISVSGISNYDRRSYFADYGPAVNMVCHAGGGNISVQTTDRTGIDGLSTNGDYVCDFGTSYACSIAAAAAALIISEHPEWTGLEVRRVLEASCDKIDAQAHPYNERGWNEHYGFGRVNAWAALTTPLPTWDTYEPDDTTNTAAPIVDGELQYRSLSTSTDVDWVCIVISNQTDLLLSVIGATNAYLELYSNTTQIATNDAGTYPHLTYTNLPAWTYYACVSSPGGVTVSNYGLHLGVLNMSDAYELDDSTNTAKVIEPRQMQYRTLYPSNDVDWAKFTLTTNAEVEIRTMGEWDGWLELGLWRTTNELARYWDPKTNPVACISTQLTAGEYYIDARDHDGWAISSYQLLLETYTDDKYESGDDTTNDATLISAGGRTSHTLFPTNDEDWLTFTVSNKANVLIMTDTINRYIKTDTVLTLYRGTNLIAYNENGNGEATLEGGSFSAIYQQGLDPDTYYIKVKGANSEVESPDYYVALDIFENQTVIDGFVSTTNGFELAWPGDASFTYKIEHTDDLMSTQDWAVATNIEGRVGRNRWTDEDTATQRFYRIVTE